jgi:hypothetical protein
LRILVRIGQGELRQKLLRETECDLFFGHPLTGLLSRACGS